MADKKISSSEEMVQFGAEMARSIARRDLILSLKGDLGAGKTTFLKGFISTLTDTPFHQIQSPTFTYLQIYEGVLPVFHFDLYRLQSYEQFKNAGFMDYLDSAGSGGVVCLEWADRIEKSLPGPLQKRVLSLEISYLGVHERRCMITEGIA